MSNEPLTTGEPEAAGAAEDGSRGARAFSRRAALGVGTTGAALLLGSTVGGGSAAAAVRRPSVHPVDRQTATYYPEEFGAKGDGVTDDTKAIQAAIDAVVSSGKSGTIQFGAKTYLVNGAPRHDRNGNAILALPGDIAGAQITLRLQGVEQATNISTTVTGPTYSSSFGSPSILGGPTPEQVGRVGQFSYCNVEIADLNVSAPANPTLAGIDLSRVVRCNVENVYISCGTTQPTTPSSFGLRLPDGQNFGRVAVDQVDVYGFYAGIVCNTAHTQIRHAITKWCYIGLALTGSGQFDAIDPHGSVFEYVGTEWCTHHVAGWSPVSGVGSIPEGDPFYLVFNLWDIEDSTPGWYSTVAHVVDTNNQIRGQANVVRVQADVGTQPAPLIVQGGALFKLNDLSSIS